MAFIDMIQIIIKMFKNPLKYQQGGQLNEQQQQMLAAFIDWLPKRVKEFQGMKPDAIVQALDGMSKTPEGQKQVQQLMEQFQQESQSVPSAKRGGKIQDFICKHARGGQVAGCGCEKHVEKAQSGLGNLGFKYLGENSYQDTNNPQQHNILSHGYEINGETVSVPTREGAYRMGINPENIGAYNNGKQVYSKAALDRIRDFYENKLPQSMVIKGQNAIPGGMPRFQAPTNYYNEKGWPISERDAIRRNNRTFYTEEPTTAGNLAWTNNQMASQLMWPGVIQDIQYNLPVGHYIDEYGNMHNFAVQGEDLTRYNNRKAQWKSDGGKVEKAQEGDIMLQPGEETIWDVKKDTLRNGTLESHKWAKNDSTLPRLKSEVMQWPGTYSRFIDGRDTILVRQTPMFNFYRSSLDPLHEIVTRSDGTPAGTNTYKTRNSWNKENQYHDKLK